MMLNSDGELEEEAETHAERHARTIAVAQVFSLSIKISLVSPDQNIFKLNRYSVWLLITLIPVKCFSK